MLHGTSLEECVAQAIGAAGGWIGFDRFMDLALYAPAMGYYSGGARKFGAYTAANIGQPFAIILDNEVISAPVIRDAITTGSG